MSSICELTLSVELKHLIHYSFKTPSPLGTPAFQNLNLTMVRGQGDDLDLKGAFMFNRMAIVVVVSFAYFQPYLISIWFSPLKAVIEKDLENLSTIGLLYA